MSKYSIETLKFVETSEPDKVAEYIADLEAKLAESEHRNEQLVDALNGEVFINYKVPMENAKLKQQLVEKDDTLETHKRVIQQMNRNCDTTMCRNKIDYAVKQLEKVKKLLEDCYVYDVEEGYLELIYKNDIDMIFKQLITEIKEGK